MSENQNFSDVSSGIEMENWAKMGATDGFIP